MWDHDGTRLYYSVGKVVMQDSATGNIGQATVALCLPLRTALFAVTRTGDFVGVRTLGESFTAPELEIATEGFRELSARVPVPQ
jgi:hypothetical protein